MDGIKNWWEPIAGERFWLGVPGRDGKGDVLAAPRAAGRAKPRPPDPLIRHVKDGDAIFHFDQSQQAIVAWSTARGRARKRRLVWSRWATGPDPESPGSQWRHSWAIGLEGTTPLDTVVPIDQIARIQSGLFPALRAFEDKVGEPLYYPFAMGSPTETHLLPGYVFKLPALFVECFPALARVADRMRWSPNARSRASDFPRIYALPLAEPSEAPVVRQAGQASALSMR